MADIHDLDVSTIRELLSSNGIYLYSGFLSNKNDEDIYNVALDLMKSKNTKYDDVNVKVKEWVLAHNALLKNLDIPSYTVYQINNLPQDKLNILAKLLGLTKNNRQNVINILRYMHKLKESELDFEMNNDLYSNLLITSEFRTIIDLLKSKPCLKNRIPELFSEMLFYNKGLRKNVDKSLYYQDTYQFMESLINSKYFDILDKILPIISNEDPGNYYNLIKLFTIKRYLGKYLKNLPSKYSPLLLIAIVKALNHGTAYYLISTVLQKAIDDENLEMIKGIVDKFNYGLLGYTFYHFPLRINTKEESDLKKLIQEARKLISTA